MENIKNDKFSLVEDKRICCIIIIRYISLVMPIMSDDNHKLSPHIFFFSELQNISHRPTWKSINRPQKIVSVFIQFKFVFHISYIKLKLFSWSFTHITLILFKRKSFTNISRSVDVYIDVTLLMLLLLIYYYWDRFIREMTFWDSIR